MDVEGDAVAGVWGWGGDNREGGSGEEGVGCPCNAHFVTCGGGWVGGCEGRRNVDRMRACCVVCGESTWADGSLYG